MGVCRPPEEREALIDEAFGQNDLHHYYQVLHMLFYTAALTAFVQDPDLCVDQPAAPQGDRVALAGEALRPSRAARQRLRAMDLPKRATPSANGQLTAYSRKGL